MFDTLEEQVERTEGTRSESRQHWMRFAGLIAASVVVFGGLLALVLAFK